MVHDLSALPLPGVPEAVAKSPEYPLTYRFLDLIQGLLFTGETVNVTDGLIDSGIYP